MVVDVTLLDALRSSTHQLLEQISVSVPSPLPHYLHQVPGVPRSTAKASLEKQDDELRYVYDELQSITHNVLSEITRLRSRVSTALSPIQSLPPELLREILKEAHYASRPRGIIKTSQVCRDWRTVLHSIACLYRHADWNKWPAWMCLEWCQRATGQPLLLSLNDTGIQKFYHPNPNPFSKIVHQTLIFSWRHLEISLNGNLRGQQYASDFFRSHNLPDLETLNFYSADDVFVNVDPTMLPNLKKIRLRGSLLTTFHPALPITRPLSSVTHLHLNFENRRTPTGWAEIIDALPNLMLLDIEFADTLLELQDHSMMNLRHLRLSAVSPYSTEHFLNAVYLPNLCSLEIELSSSHDEFKPYVSITKVSPSPYFWSLSFCTACLTKS